jgi:hypothetical protein
MFPGTVVRIMNGHHSPSKLLSIEEKGWCNCRSGVRCVKIGEEEPVELRGEHNG